MRLVTLLSGMFIVLFMVLRARSAAAEIRHRFIAIDEARDSLLFTDENNAAANWSVKIAKGRDLQLIGGNRVCCG